MRLPRPCHQPLCPELTHEQYCPAHAAQHQARYNRRRGSAAQRGYGATWRKVRIAYLRSKGWRCESCGSRPFDTSKLHVHHRDRQPKGPDRYNHANLEALCESCHNALPEHRETMT